MLFILISFSSALNRTLHHLLILVVHHFYRPIIIIVHLPFTTRTTISRLLVLKIFSSLHRFPARPCGTSLLLLNFSCRLLWRLGSSPPLVLSTRHTTPTSLTTRLRHHSHFRVVHIRTLSSSAISSKSGRSLLIVCSLDSESFSNGQYFLRCCHSCHIIQQRRCIADSGRRFTSRASSQSPPYV